MNSCTYCESLTPAIQESFYCSLAMEENSNVSSNAFYFSTNNMRSGVHRSRFTIRSIQNGYQKYDVNGKLVVLKEDTLLVLHEGTLFENFLHEEYFVEGLTIALNPIFVNYYAYFLSSTHQKLLDQPYDTCEMPFGIQTGLYSKSSRMRDITESIVRSIKHESRDPLFFQELFLEAFRELLVINDDLKATIGKLKALKISTKMELYRRLCDARDYIDAHLHHRFTLEKIAQKSCLSPFHFLRSFAELFGCTPYQYIQAERMKKALFDMTHTVYGLEQIMTSVGFDNKRTFQRAFQKKYGMTALQYLTSIRA